MAIAQLPKRLERTKIVQLSDFHYDGICLSEKLLAQAIAVTNELEPDLILLTGDYVTRNPKPINRLASRLQDLRASSGIYAVLGNHDLEMPHSRSQITEALTNVGIQVLWNQVVYPLGEGLVRLLQQIKNQIKLASDRLEPQKRKRQLKTEQELKH